MVISLFFLFYSFFLFLLCARLLGIPISDIEKIAILQHLTFLYHLPCKEPKAI